MTRSRRRSLVAEGWVVVRIRADDPHSVPRTELSGASARAARQMYDELQERTQDGLLLINPAGVRQKSRRAGEEDAQARVPEQGADGGLDPQPDPHGGLEPQPAQEPDQTSLGI